MSVSDQFIDMCLTEAETLRQEWRFVDAQVQATQAFEAMCEETAPRTDVGTHPQWPRYQAFLSRLNADLQRQPTPPPDFYVYNALGGLMKQLDHLRRAFEQGSVDLYEDETARAYVDLAIGSLKQAREALLEGRRIADPRVRS